MNVYTYCFRNTCPVNDAVIDYHLEIANKSLVRVESIKAVIDDLGPMFHEAIADILIDTFGGRQSMRANHHGVWIVTHRVARPWWKRIWR